MADSDNVVSNGASGAAAGGAVGGPWGAVIGGAGGILAGLINGDRSQPTPDLAALFQTIAASGANERQLINQLPVDLQPLYAQYKEQMGAAGQTYSDTNAGIGQTLEDKTAALYGPTSPAVQATLAALKQQDYSTLPGTVTNLKGVLAGMPGGLSTGGARKAVTNAVMAPATAYSQQAANVTGTQLTAQQQATQAAINKVAALDETTAQTMLGMSKEQATQILQYGRQDLQTQLTQLLNQSNIQTNQTLAAEGIQSNAGYQNAVANNANQAAITNGLVNTGTGIISSLASTPPASSSTGFDPNTMSTPNYANANPTLYGLTN